MVRVLSSGIIWNSWRSLIRRKNDKITKISKLSARSKNQGLTENSTIKYASIFLPVEVCYKDYEDRFNYSYTQFYFGSLHETGHAIGLDHAKGENLIEPVDVMYYEDPTNEINGTYYSLRQEISQLDLDKLEEMYGSDKP